MKHIHIREIEYIYSTYYMELNGEEESLDFVKVTFDFAYIRDCKITIAVKEIKEVSEYEIKKHILKCMDLLLERKFIDEI